MPASYRSSRVAELPTKRDRSGPRLPARIGNPKHPETVQRILMAAEQIFAERGLAGARTGAIARAAHVNKALLYYYFRSKEELYQVALRNLFGQLRGHIEAALTPPSSAADQLAQFVNGYFDFVTAHPNYPRLIQREVMGRGAKLDSIVNEYFRPLHHRVAALIRAGIASGEFRRVDAQHTVVTLIGMTVFYFAAAPVLAELWQCNPLEPSRVEARRRATLDFLEHGLFAHPARKQ